jgi:hypothetical protein
MLRHQLAVAERERPRAHTRLRWPDRAWLALLAETDTVPAQRLAATRLIVTPTILRWQRDIVRRRWARRSEFTLRCEGYRRSATLETAPKRRIATRTAPQAGTPGGCAGRVAASGLL